MGIISYPEGYFEKRHDLTIGKHVYSDTEHPRTSAGKWRDAPGSHHGGGGGPHNHGPSGGGKKVPQDPHGSTATSKPPVPDKPKEPEKPKLTPDEQRIKDAQDRVKAAGDVPEIKNKADYPKAIEYMKKLGTDMKVHANTKPIEVLTAMHATRTFVEKTGYSPGKVELTKHADVRRTFGKRAARAAGFYMPTDKTVYMHKTEKLSAHTHKTGEYTVGSGKYDYATTTFWHEYGHSVDYSLGTGSQQQIKYGVPGYGSPGSYGYSKAELASQGMSGYGLTIRDEFIAEYVSGHMQGVKFGPAVHDAYKKMGGPSLGGEVK